MDTRESRTPRENGAALRGAAALTAVPFLLGGLLGAFSCGSAAAGGAEELASYIGAYVQAALTGEAAAPGFLFLLWEDLKYPAAALVLGLTAMGVVGIPVLFFLRGFLSAFALTAFTAAYGAAGAPLGFLLMGISDLVSIPALFLIGGQSMTSSGQLLSCLTQGRRVNGVFSPSYWLRAGCALGAVVLWTGAVSLLHPVLVSLAAQLCS